MQIFLTEEEAVILKEFLDNAISNLRMEISRTDKETYRETLKHQKSLLMSIIEKLNAEELVK